MNPATLLTSKIMSQKDGCHFKPLNLGQFAAENGGYLKYSPYVAKAPTPPSIESAPEGRLLVTLRSVWQKLWSPITVLSFIFLVMELFSNGTSPPNQELSFLVFLAIKCDHIFHQQNGMKGMCETLALFFFLIEVQFIYNVLISAVQQNDSVVQDIYIYVYIFTYTTLLYIFSIMAYHRIQNMVSCAKQQDFVVYPSYIYQFTSANSKILVLPSLTSPPPWTALLL